MSTNSENPRKGKDFQFRVKRIAEQKFGQLFVAEKAVRIGLPPKEHKFDLVSEDNTIIIECKCYSWTSSGNVPSAKMATLDEAILYMRSVPYYAHKIIVMSRELRSQNGESLANYFVEKHGHLLADIAVWEINKQDRVREVRDYGGKANLKC